MPESAVQENLPDARWKATYRFFKLTAEDRIEIADGPTAIEIESIVFYVNRDGVFRGPCFFISNQQKIYYSEGGADRLCTWIYELTPESKDINGNQIASYRQAMKTIENEVQWIKSIARR
jgi:hypothetical protein